ncbi:PREDICTED: HAUS augmin-like complex subunit 6 isoform X6 [Crocodylus porosus]|uniref:HAUS augmin-like complex subunit 6 isoform X6 n=1 Tax=Crocodylus porosus TaxID=8502 RepID=UPI00093EE584|nr:PREDICTED: HAUS augmin-like complex subunit 6 isoform X6 [Crocodylus porosus]XP_019410440.1 PREDICTED: HAUS augmin-like complex subunit 6 isoform X6 [Crocodylus porosus]
MHFIWLHTSCLLNWIIHAQQRLSADKKGDAEFRKKCCEWLKEISVECGNIFPAVVASLFLSPGGPKFIHLMYHFARYVMIQAMRTDCKDAGIYFPEAVILRPDDLYRAAARCKVASNKFLQVVQKEDFVIQEYQKKAQLLTKQIKDLRSECADLHKQLQRIEKNDQNQSNRAEKVQKVCSMWTTVTETFAGLEKEKEVVDSVVKGHFDQYTLDATDIAISVPRLLLDKIENEMYRLHIGSVYDTGKLNFLTVIQLLNEALKILRSECQQVDRKALNLDLQYIEEKTKFQSKTLLGLRSMRHKLKREDHVSIRKSVVEKQKEWDMKWENIFGQSPFGLFKVQNPALDLLPAMSALSFDPATEEAYKTSVFCQYPASVPDAPKKGYHKRVDGALGSTMSTAELTSSGRIFSLSSELATSENSCPVLEKKVHTETPKRKEHSLSQKILKCGVARPLEAWNNRDSPVLQTPTPVKREDPYRKAKEQLAEEVANVVVSESPSSSDGKGMELEDLIESLASNPFLARKQIPRTPENLITEIRSSWRKAVQDGYPSDTELAQTEMVTEGVLLDIKPVPQNRIDSSVTCFMSSSHISDLSTSNFNVVEGKSLLNWMTPEPPKQVMFSHISDSPIQKPATRALANKRTLQKELKGTVLNEILKENVQELMPAMDKSINVLNSQENCNKVTNTLSPYCQNSTMHSTLSWDASQMVSGISSDSRDIIQFGILHETFPEELGNLSLTSPQSSETDDILGSNWRDSRSLTESTKNEWTTQECKLDLESIRKRYEALKKTLFGNDSALACKKQFVRNNSQLSFTPSSTETHDVFSPSEKFFTLDTEYIGTPSHKSLPHRKHSLSPLVSFTPVQERLRLVAQKKPGDFLHNSKEEETLTEKLDAKESSSARKICKDTVSQLEL